MNDEVMSRNTGTNRHPVDELAEIRNTVKTLKERESELVAQISDMMGDGDSLGGHEYIARQIVSTRKGALDTKLLEKAGVQVDAFRKADVTVYQMRLEPRAMEAAE